MYYVDDIFVGEMSKMVIDVMLCDFDLYMVYYYELNIEDYKFMIIGQYGGIGVLIWKMGDYIFIVEFYEGNFV